MDADKLQYVFVLGEKAAMPAKGFNIPKTSGLQTYLSAFHQEGEGRKQPLH